MKKTSIALSFLLTTSLYSGNPEGAKKETFRATFEQNKTAILAITATVIGATALTMAIKKYKKSEKKKIEKKSRFSIPFMSN